jgi:hypothetical protein
MFTRLHNTYENIHIEIPVEIFNRERRNKQILNMKVPIYIYIYIYIYIDMLIGVVKNIILTTSITSHLITLHHVQKLHDMFSIFCERDYIISEHLLTPSPFLPCVRIELRNCEFLRNSLLENFTRTFQTMSFSFNGVQIQH